MSFYKNNEKDKIWWKEPDESIGQFVFTFDKKKMYNLYTDYPYNMTEEQVQQFDKENPEWADYFKDRKG
jgi:hypothetical protein